MAKSRTGLQVLRKVFQHPFSVSNNCGNHAAEVWCGNDYVGFIARSKTTGRWAVTHNVLLEDGDPKYRFGNPVEAAKEYYKALPGPVQAPWTCAALVALK